MEVLSKEQFMSLVYANFEKKEKEKIAKEKKKEFDYHAYKIKKVMDHNLKYTNKKNRRR